MNNMNSELVKLFGCAIEEASELNVARVEQEAVRRGYIVDPRVCNDSVLQFLLSEPLDYNSTFYASWDDITSRSRFEIFIDQITHYLTTYGTDFAMGNGYVPRELEDVPVLPYNAYKVITCVTREEMFNRCHEFLKTDVALKSDTVKVLVDFILECVRKNVTVRDKRAFVEEIKNREARTLLQVAWNIFPSDKFELFKYIITRTTGMTMVIQNKTMIDQIKTSPNPFKFRDLNDKEMEKLSSIFLRYKNLFLAFKHNRYVDNSTYINKLRKMAVKNHKPMQKTVWDRITSDPSVTAEEVAVHINDATIFRKITILQALRYNFNLEVLGAQKTVIVRNGKIFNTDYDRKLTKSEEYRLQRIATVIADSIVSHLKTKACVIKYAPGVDIKAPTSEKSFIGNYPIGTSYKMDVHNMIGIYWRNEWGTRDFDLSLMDINGCRIGWNSGWSNINVIYSGDMTSADPEATEIMYVKSACPDSVVNVNRFSGSNGSKLRLFFAQEHAMNFGRNYMVDPNNIKLSVDLVSEKAGQNLGLIYDNKFVLMDVQVNNRRVSRNSDVDLLTNLKCKAESFVSLNSFLEAAEFVDYDKLNPENAEHKLLLDQIEVGNVQVLDLNNIDRDTLINLFK